MKKNIYIKPETEVVAVYALGNILTESKYFISGDMDDVTIIDGNGEGYDNGDDFEIDSKGNNIWDTWDAWDGWKD